MYDSEQIRSEELADLLPWLEGLAQRLVRDPGTAADLTQETVLTATGRTGPSEGSTRAWLRGVLWNRARRYFRSETQRRRREEHAARAERLPADMAVERAEIAQRLLAAVLAQPDPYRSVLAEHFLEGRPLIEIARSKAMSAATVRSHLRRGLERMRKELGEGKGAHFLGALLAPLARAPLPQGKTLLLAKASLLQRLGAAGLVLAVLGSALGSYALRDLAHLLQVRHQGSRWPLGWKIARPMSSP